MEFFEKVHSLQTILINKIGLGIIMYIIEILNRKNLMEIQVNLSFADLNDNLAYLKNKIQIRLNKNWC